MEELTSENLSLGEELSELKNSHKLMSEEYDKLRQRIKNYKTKFRYLGD